MDKLLNDPKTREAQERWLRQIENQFLTRQLARRIEAVQPEPVEIPPMQPLPTE